VRRLLLVLAALTLLAAGCGTDEKSGSSSSAASSSSSSSSVANPAGGKPKVVPPKGPPPRRLVTKDLRTGTGREAKPGDTVTVQYVGVLYKNGKQFDASWDHGKPFDFVLEAGQVIPGWDRGVTGMKVGGRRELIIPPSLGYGAKGSGPIPPKATLVFVIDLLDVK
jgi:peptidylprolyl isomerase